MAEKNTTNPAALLDEPMRTLYDLLTSLTNAGLTPAEAQDVMGGMVARVLAIHPATAPAQGGTE